MVSAIGPSTYRTGLSDWTGSPPSKPAAVSADLVALGASSETEAQIAIRTAEGDTVTISLDAEAEAAYAFYRRPATADAAGLQARVLTTSVSRELSLSVQGDLSEQERADIARLLQQIERVIRSFVKGNENAASHQALAGPRLETLAGYALNLQHTDRLTMVQVADEPDASPSTTGAVSQPAILPMPAGPAADEDAGTPATPVKTGTETPLGGPTPVAGDVLDEIVELAKASGVDLPKVGAQLAKTLRQSLHRLGTEAGAQPFRPLLAEISARLPGRLHEAARADRGAEAA